MYKEKAQFAKNLKYLRISLGISQTQLGNAVCTTKTVISNLERDKYPPSTEDLLLLSRYFRIPIDKSYYIGNNSRRSNYVLYK